MVCTYTYLRANDISALRGSWGDPVEPMRTYVTVLSRLPLVARTSRLHRLLHPLRNKLLAAEVKVKSHRRCKSTYSGLVSKRADPTWGLVFQRPGVNIESTRASERQTEEGNENAARSERA